jgi:hypothetical protein
MLSGMKPFSAARPFLLVAPLFVVARASSTPPATDPKLEDLAWMAGHWEGDARGAHVEEVWLAPGGGVMLGMNREARAGGKGSFEFLRIEPRADGLAYIASPGGHGATEFPLAGFGEHFVQFENPAHDFPKSIRYELNPEGHLCARVAGEEGGKEQALEWTWKRVAAK